MTVLSVHIKTKLCQVVEAMMRRRDDLAFRQEMKFRNKMVEYVTDWVLGTSHQIAPPLRADASSISRELDQACIRRSPAAEGTAAAAEESDRGDLMEAKSQLFLKYFTLFMNLLNDCNEVEMAEGPGRLETLRNATIQGELPIAMALANVVSTSQMDELGARLRNAVRREAFVALLWNIFYRKSRC
ncbi:neurofibromin-like [Choristoneura fumiferana]|uniref:neurofibromin-like n=1 Tax=Choristoneura fumiferana TaxID=7141 RepID=UPI003D15EA2F